jgi:hypothetical protein
VGPGRAVSADRLRRRSGVTDFGARGPSRPASPRAELAATSSWPRVFSRRGRYQNFALRAVGCNETYSVGRRGRPGSAVVRSHKLTVGVAATSARGRRQREGVAVLEISGAAADIGAAATCCSRRSAARSRLHGSAECEIAASEGTAHRCRAEHGHDRLPGPSRASASSSVRPGSHHPATTPRRAFAVNGPGGGGLHEPQRTTPASGTRLHAVRGEGYACIGVYETVEPRLSQDDRHRRRVDMNHLAEVARWSWRRCIECGDRRQPSRHGMTSWPAVPCGSVEQAVPGIAKELNAGVSMRDRGAARSQQQRQQGERAGRQPPRPAARGARGRCDRESLASLGRPGQAGSGSRDVEATSRGREDGRNCSVVRGVRAGVVWPRERAVASTRLTEVAAGCERLRQG